MKLTKRGNLAVGICLSVAFLPYTVAVYYFIRFIGISAGSLMGFLISDAGFVFVVLSINFFIKAFSNEKQAGKLRG
ncbi:MAG: hypothetical protein M1129_06185 [Candidatus Thermoplasmatota archaeon]|nr:hypothetical protein [Candidatus Thermoplasmatota archaeon]